MMDSDDLWRELDLEGLLRYPELIPSTKSSSNVIKKSSTIDPLYNGSNYHLKGNKTMISNPHLVHEKTWQKPSYSVLKERYQSVPHQPVLYHPKHIDRLADPLRGKYSKYDEILNEKNKPKLSRPVRKEWDDNTLINSQTRGVFLTEPKSSSLRNHSYNNKDDDDDSSNNDDGDRNDNDNGENDRYDSNRLNRANRNNKINPKNNSIVNRFHRHISDSLKYSKNQTLSSIIRHSKQAWKEDIRSNNQPNASRPGNTRLKQQSVSNKDKDKMKRYTYRHSSGDVILDKIKSSGYNYHIKTKVHISNNSNKNKSKNNSNQRMDDPLFSARSSNNNPHSNQNIPLEGYIKGGFLTKQKEKISLYSRIDQSVLIQKSREISPYRRYDGIRDSHKNMQVPASSQESRKILKPPMLCTHGSKSAPAVISSSLDKSNLHNTRNNQMSNRRIGRENKVDRLKSTIRDFREEEQNITKTMTMTMNMAVPSPSSGISGSTAPLATLNTKFVTAGMRKPTISTTVPERSTKEIMTTLKMIESKESSRYDSIESKLLTSQLAKYVERIDGHLNTAKHYSKSFKNVMNEEIVPLSHGDVSTSENIIENPLFHSESITIVNNNNHQSDSIIEQQSIASATSTNDMDTKVKNDENMERNSDDNNFNPDQEQEQQENSVVDIKDEMDREPIEIETAIKEEEKEEETVIEIETERYVNKDTNNNDTMDIVPTTEPESMEINDEYVEDFEEYE